MLWSDTSVRRTTGYRGPDRRTIGGADAGRPWRSALLALVAGTAAAGVALVVLVARPDAAVTLHTVSRSLSAAGWMIAGLLLLCSWRLGGHAAHALLGIGLVLVAAELPVASYLVRTMQTGDGTEVRIATTALLAGAGLHLLRAASAEQVETGLRPARASFLTLSGALVAAAALTAALSASATRVPFALVVVLKTGLWLAVAVNLGLRGRTLGPALRRAVPAALALQGSATLLSLAPSATGHAGATVSEVSAAVLVSAVALDCVGATIRTHSLRSLRTIASLADHADAATLDRQRRHDACSALAAIRSTGTTLATRGDTLAPAVRDQLRTAVLQELARVQRMLETEPSTRRRDVDVTTELGPVVTAWRQRGLGVELLPASATAHTDPDVLVRIVNNLLDNAHRHAGAAARVRVSCDLDADVVHLSVVDDGAGMPPALRDGVFHAGFSGAATGQGLGLASARRLAREQGGDLRMIGIDGGCWFVLTLPSATGSADPRRRVADR